MYVRTYRSIPLTLFMRRLYSDGDWSAHCHDYMLATGKQARRLAPHCSRPLFCKEVSRSPVSCTGRIPTEIGRLTAMKECLLECECFVKDENRKERFVRTLYPGSHFGEIAIITGTRRTATIQTKNYSTIGQVTKEHFLELFQIFPEVKNRMTAALA